MRMSIVKACVFPTQDASFYASARARGFWSTDAAWPKPSLREQSMIQLEVDKSYHLRRSVLEQWLHLLVTRRH
jgi:hypothetical protein